MEIRPKLIESLELYVKQQLKRSVNADLLYSIKLSKSTKSFYIKIFYISNNNKPIFKTTRISDHKVIVREPKICKVVTDNTNFKSLCKAIDNNIKSLKYRKMDILLKEISIPKASCYKVAA